MSLYGQMEVCGVSRLFGDNNVKCSKLKSIERLRASFKIIACREYNYQRK